MRSDDILRIDDQLLRGAALSSLLLVVVAGASLLLPAELRGPTPRLLCLLGFLALAPLAFLLSGLHFRQREARAMALMGLIDRHIELSAEDLLRNSELTPTTLDQAIRDLNSSGVRHVVWDRREGLIQDGRIRRPRLHFETCSACGTKIALDVPLYEAAVARCPSCDTPLDAREVDDRKQAVIDELSRRNEPPQAKGCRSSTRSFSTPVFLLLLVLCWPLALLYGARHWATTTFSLDP